MPDVPSAVTYGVAAQGQAVYGASPTTAVWAYSPWDSTTVTAAVAAGAGTAPPAPVVAATATVVRGTLTWGTGTSPLVGAQVVVTFSTTLPATPVVVVSANNTATGLLVPTVTAVSATAFTIGLATVPAASQANTVYSVSWYLSL